MSKRAVFAPSAEVEAKLGKGSDALETYRDMFGFEVVPTSDGKWAVAALLTPEAWTNVVKSAHAATRQIPVAEIATIEFGEMTNVVVKGCGVPGFYYSLYGAADLGSFTPRSEGAPRLEAPAGGFTGGYAGTVDVYGPRLCGTDGEVEFSGVVKPSDAAGFFSVGVMLAPGVGPSDKGGVPFKPTPRMMPVKW